MPVLLLLLLLLLLLVVLFVACGWQVTEEVRSAVVEFVIWNILRKK